MHFEPLLMAKPPGSESVMGARGHLALSWFAVSALFFLRHELSTREPFQAHASHDMLRRFLSNVTAFAASRGIS